MVLGWLLVAICFLLTLQKALNRCHPDNRAMSPGQVWLNLIPCLNLVWSFLTVTRVADSLDREFRDRRLRTEGDYGRGIGITACVLNLVGGIPYIGVLFALGGLVCFIIYWVKIAGYSKQLADDEGYDRDDDYDDRPRKRSVRDDRYEDDEYEEDDRPRRRSVRDDDEEDDQPRSRRRDDEYDDEDDADDDRPRRRR